METEDKLLVDETFTVAMEEKGSEDENTEFSIYKETGEAVHEAKEKTMVNREKCNKESEFKNKYGKRTSLNEKISKLEELLRLTEFKDVVACNGKIVPPSSEIYKNLSNAMERANKMLPKYIYTVLLKNRYNVYSNLLSFLNIEAPVDEMSFDQSTLNTSNDTIEFRLDVTEIWLSMKPETILYKFKERDRLIRALRKNSWTHVLFEQIHNFTNLPCAFAFKKSKTSESGVFVTVSGSCSECNSEFDGQILDEPQDGEKVMMECAVRNFNPSVEHIKKRQLKGALRTAVSNKLIEYNLLPYQYRRNEAHRLIQTIGQESPPNLTKKEVLRKVRQEGIDKQLGTTSNRALDGLCTLKYADKYEGSIHNIGHDPPYVHYWTKEQLLIYEKFPDILYIDATGCVAKPIKLPNNEFCSHIYLFQAVAQINEKTVPVFQMLSAAQNTVAIMTWLLEFLRTGNSENPKFPLPKEVVTDFDKALLGAVSRVFSESKSLKDYLENCFHIIMGDKDEFPPCLIRLDICHYTQMIARWKCYPSHQPGVRTLYLRAMSLLRNQDNFDDFQKIAIAILTLALSRNGGKDSFAFKARDFLKEKIRGTVDDVMENVVKDFEKFDKLQERELDIVGENKMQSTSLGTWVKVAFDKIKEQAENEEFINDEYYDDVNGYCLPSFALKVKSLLLYFPLYTEIMPKIRGYGAVNATSAAVESEFNDLKHRTFRNAGLPVRADKFVARHILEIPKKLKEAATRSIAITKEGEIEAIIKETKFVKKIVKRTENSEEPAEKIYDENCVKNKKRKYHSVKENFLEDYHETNVKELNEEHNWRNKNKKINGINKINVNKDDYMFQEVQDEILINTEKIEDVSIADDDSDNEVLMDVRNYKELQTLRSKNRPQRKGARYGDPCPHFEPSL